MQLKKEGESLPRLEEGLAQARSEKEKYVALEEQFKTYKDKLIEKTEKRKEEERKLKVIRSGSFLGEYCRFDATEDAILRMLP